jgi:hypothetical protein
MKEKINSLRIEVDRFAKIVNTQSKSTPSYIEIISVVFSILAVIKELEQCGFTRGEIVPYLTPVRETLSQSPFFKRMQNWPRGYQGDFETIEYLMSAVNPNVAKVGGLQSQGVKGEVVVVYLDPLTTQDLKSSGFPVG